MDGKAASPQAEAPLFQALVKPHRSLSDKGMVVVICCMLIASSMVTGMAAFLGAWPVVGFNGADILLAILLIRLNIRAGRTREYIRLQQEALEIFRLDVRGRRERIALQPYWLRVVLEERPGTVPKLLLAGGDARTEIARPLGEAEKRALAVSLEGALVRWRHPEFDNPQLRALPGPDPDT